VTDVLAPLVGLADVADALDAARASADAAFGHRALRRGAARIATEIALRTAVASAALEGSEHELAQVRGGTVTDPVLQGSLRVNADLVRLGPQWMIAPPQVLTRLHLLAARGAGVEVGRPSSGSANRLVALSAVLGSAAPALLRAAVVHGELLALRAFPGPNGVVARAAGRLTLIAAGLDPRGLLPVDVAHFARGPEYVGAANAFVTGTPDGLRAWIRHCAGCVVAAADVLIEVCEEVG
jgi:hypothetical protein